MAPTLHQHSGLAGAGVAGETSPGGTRLAAGHLLSQPRGGGRGQGGPSAGAPGLGAGEGGGAEGWRVGSVHGVSGTAAFPEELRPVSRRRAGVTRAPAKVLVPPPRRVTWCGASARLHPALEHARAFPPAQSGAPGGPQGTPARDGRRGWSGVGCSVWGLCPWGAQVARVSPLTER